LYLESKGSISGRETEFFLSPYVQNGSGGKHGWRRRLTNLRSFTSTPTIFMFGYSDNFKVYCKEHFMI
jgi:hypothetical protein